MCNNCEKSQADLIIVRREILKRFKQIRDFSICTWQACYWSMLSESCNLDTAVHKQPYFIVVNFQCLYQCLFHPLWDCFKWGNQYVEMHEGVYYHQDVYIHCVFVFFHLLVVVVIIFTFTIIIIITITYFNLLSLASHQFFNFFCYLYMYLYFCLHNCVCLFFTYSVDCLTPKSDYYLIFQYKSLLNQTIMS